MAKLKYYSIIILAGLLALGAIQNVASTEINFLLWSFQASRVLIIIFALLVGFLIGWIWGTRKKV